MGETPPYLTLDRDEVGLAFVGHGFGHERLSAPRGAVEQNTPGRRHAELLELLRVLHGVLHKLLQLALDALKDKKKRKIKQIENEKRKIMSTQRTDTTAIKHDFGPFFGFIIRRRICKKKRKAQAHPTMFDTQAEKTTPHLRKNIVQLFFFTNSFTINSSKTTLKSYPSTTPA